MTILRIGSVILINALNACVTYAQIVIKVFIILAL